MEDSSFHIAASNDPLQRARRVQYLRKLSGLTRKEFHVSCGISEGTMQHWENGEPPITVQGAKRLADGLAKVGIRVAVEWILTGIGSAPKNPNTKCSNFQSSDFGNAMASYDFKELTDKKSIEELLAAFKKIEVNAVEFWLDDDAMEPCFYKGGAVAASHWLLEDEIDQALAKACIIQTDKGKFLCRMLEKDRILNTYNLIAINTRSEFAQAYKNVKIIGAAPVIFYCDLKNK